MFSNEYPQFQPSRKYITSIPKESRNNKKIISLKITLESSGYTLLIQQGWEYHETFPKSIPFDDECFQYKPVFEGGETFPKNLSEKPVVIVKRPR